MTSSLPSQLLDSIKRPSSTWWLLLLSCGLILPVLALFVLPTMGFHTGVSLVEKFLPLLPILLIGLFVFLKFLDFILKTGPAPIALYMLVAWYAANFLNSQLITYTGINTRFRTLHIALFLVPLGVFLWKMRKSLLREYPFMKGFLAFMALVITYFVFFNSNAQLGIVEAGTWADGNVAIKKMIGHFYNMTMIVMAAGAFWLARRPADLFDLLNKGFLWVTSICSLVCVAGYPLHFQVMKVDGFLRSVGFLGHPNAFAHRMGIIMLYSIGLLFYYQLNTQRPFPRWLIYASLGANLLGLLVALSKGAIAGVLLCTLILVATNSTSLKQLQKTVFQGGLALGVLGIVGLGAFGLVSEQSFIEIIQKRLEDTGSMDWRELTWGGLMSTMTWKTWVVGEGHTAANAMLYQLSYSEKDINPVILIHNAYLEYIYDYGVLGYTIFLPVIMLVIRFVKGLFVQVNPMIRPLIATGLALSTYYLIAAGVDEFTYMFDAVVLFWGLTTVLVSSFFWHKHQPEAFEGVTHE